MSKRGVVGRGPGSGKPIGVAEITKKRRHVPGAVGDGALGGSAKVADSQFYIMLRSRVRDSTASTPSSAR